jgi:ABC-type transport system involved in multi-copper enzyme maturation permease subunit
VRVAWVAAAYTFRELIRRKVFVVVPIVTVAFIALYAVGNLYAFDFSSGFLDDDSRVLDARLVTGASLLGLAMFTTFFLGTVLAVFLTFGAVRGDAETGLLQPLVVRPVGRGALLLGRYLGTVVVSAGYVLLLFGLAVVTTGWIGGWWPENVVSSALFLCSGMFVVAALSILGSVFMTTIPNGVAVLMVYGAGLLAGLLGQIGEALRSDGLERVGHIASWILPFEALYQAALHALTAPEGGIAGFVVRLGPLGGAEPPGVWLVPWVALYIVLVGVLALSLFARRDL